eukprot:3995153-Lingulodinium_polyedra.AAC.1
MVIGQGALQEDRTVVGHGFVWVLAVAERHRQGPFRAPVVARGKARTIQHLTSRGCACRARESGVVERTPSEISSGP